MYDILLSLLTKIAFAIALAWLLLWLLDVADQVRIARAIQRRWAEFEPEYRPQPVYVLVYRILRGELF